MFRNLLKYYKAYFGLFGFIIYSLTASAAVTGREITWRNPVPNYINEEEYLESIYFDGAYYTDTLHHIPVYRYRVHNPVPHFSHQITLDNKDFIPVTGKEDAILRLYNFHREEIILHHEIQSARKKSYSVATFYPFVYDSATDTFKKLISFDLSAEQVFDHSLQFMPGADFAENSVLANGSWYKICVEETGIYRLGYNDLEALGINPGSVQKQNIRLFGNGGGMLPEANAAFEFSDLKENAVYVSGSATGTFGQNDYILFYGLSPNTWHAEFFPENDENNGEDDEPSGRWLFRHNVHLYATESCYFITTDQGQGKRIESAGSVQDTPTHQVSTFRDYAFHQQDLDNLLGSGRVWFGEVFDATLNRQFPFDFPNLASDAPATLEAYLAARAPVGSSFTVSAGGQQQQFPILPINPADYNGYYVRVNNGFMNFNPNQPDRVTVNLTYNRPGAGTRGYLNYLSVNADRNLRFSGGQMPFRQVDHIGPGKIVEYVLSDFGPNVTVWDVTDRFHIKEQQVTQQGNTRRFTQPAGNIREFIAFDGSTYLSANLVGQIPNQNLHAMESSDLIIVSPEKLIPAAERLAQYRRDNNGLTVTIVTTDQVYHEFSSGSPDISAIRNFLRMFYERAGTPDQMPAYLLLFGNGTYDNKDLLGFGGNLIPTYQSYASISFRASYMTDDYFGLLGENEGQDAAGVVDIGIGRFPVRTLEQAEMLVDKTIRYEKRIPGMEPGEDNLDFTGVVSNYADWRNNVVFVADDGDNNTHFLHAEEFADELQANHPQYNIQKIYLDAYQQVTLAGGLRYPDVNRAINEAVNRGVLLINYIGHGGKRGLAQQRVLTFEDIAGWNNKYNMPVFMTATCEFSSFDHPDPDDLYAGVRIVLKPIGGTVALFTTTRLAWSGNNKTLNANFMETMFSADADGNNYRMGDLIRIAKEKSSGVSLPMQLRNFVLLGDPSMQMAFPEHRVVTEHMPDTLRAFQEVTVSGYVTDIYGNKLQNYNGVLFPTIYDKEETFRTLGNNQGSHPRDFNMRNSVLYRGKASIHDGEFSFTFMVPRDIAYNYGSGRISYYMDDGQADGHGFYENFIIGGTLDNFTPDHEGPVIDLYMNDTTFVSGDYTNENPILLAFLYDESGINMTGSIGHDIVAYLNNSGDPIRLTNYYEAAMDTYKSGRVVYPFFNLEDGHHTLLMRAWDIHNNPSTASIDFVVSSAGRIVLGDLMNYPNPFSYDTWFTFKHNQAFNELDVRIDIYDLQGRLVNTIKERVSSAGFQSAPIHWDGVSNDGRLLGNGIYLYRLTLRTPSGERSRQTEKLVIFR
ncbi:MAG: T9SS C-terminal target domain-containing protein [Bacteroidia bacterium]|nr:MAG: T9SS C-terminal target domain-containing protein [Bacteroidia bacterium]